MGTSDGTISYNSQELHNLHSSLSSNSKGIKDEIEGLISEAENLKKSGKWSGDMYDAFMLNIRNYKKEHLDPLLEVMDEYVDAVGEAAQRTEETTNAGVARFQ